MKKKVTFSKPQEYVLTSTKTRLLFLAGVGSGKTHLAGFWTGYLISTFPSVFGFIGANTYNQLSTSTLFRVRQVWFEYFGWKEGRDYVIDKQPPQGWVDTYHRRNFKEWRGIITFRWGAVVFVGSLDNGKAHDGKEFGWAALDETKDTREKDVKETITTRLRMGGMFIGEDGQVNNEGGVPWLPLLVTTSPARVQWINDWFGLEEYQNEIVSEAVSKTEYFAKEYGNKCVCISSTWHNQKNLPINYINDILSDNSSEVGEKLIYANPFTKVGGSFYSGFDRMVHVKEFDMNPDLPFHLALDQNVTPYITGTVWQAEIIEGRTQLRQLDEILLPNPKNRTKFIGLELIKRWGHYITTLYYYGDPSGKKRDTRHNDNDYAIITKILRKYINNKSDRVPHAHPPVIRRKDFINSIFEGAYPIEIIIHPRCKKSIEDLENLKEDINGKKAKTKVTLPNGEKAEKYGHTSDAMDYIVCEMFAGYFDRDYNT